MRVTASDIKTTSGPAGVLLRQWRDIRGKTQLDLSFDAGVSQKHISFVESGRSVPSRQTLLDLAQALDVPFRERNELLTAASVLGARHVKVGDFLHTDTPMPKVIESFAALCEDAAAAGTRILP